MTIKKLSEYKGASRFGTCTECGEQESDSHRLYRLQFNCVSVCLCPDCFNKAQIAMNEVSIESHKRPQDKWGKWVVREVQCPNCFEYFPTDCFSTEELNKCPVCRKTMR